MLGRIIGLAFFIPMVILWRKNRIPAGYKPKLVVLFILGGAQGVLGWYMVKSGLVDVPHVSHFRLAAHLMLALFVFAALLWTALDLLRPVPSGSSRSLKKLTHITMLLLILQLFMGALVAGLKSRGHRAATTVADAQELARVLAGEIGEGDLVVCLGAGDITRWAADLPEAIARERGE